jgi:hypothetical protein
MRKLLLSIILLCFLPFNSFAENHEAELEKQLEIQEKITSIRDLTSCGVLYYNLSLYFAVAHSIGVEFNHDPQLLETYKTIHQNAFTKHKQFSDKNFEVYSELIAMGVPETFASQPGYAGQRMAIDSITAMTKSLTEDISKGNTFLTGLLDVSDTCDQILLELD